MLTVRPLVPAALAFTLGVALGLRADAAPDWSAPAALGLLVCFGISVLLRRRKLAAAVGIPLFLALGLLATLRVGRLPAAAVIDPDGTTLLRGRVEGAVARQAEGFRFLLREEHAAACGVDGAILVTVAAGDADLARGDAVQLRARVRPVGGRRNPGSMDWPRFWARRGVLAEARVPDAAGVVRLEAGQGLLSAVDRARGRVARVLTSGVSSAERALVLALVTGERGRLPRELRQSFADAGLAHLLAVSGLHIASVIGAVFGLVLFLLSRSQRLLLAINVRGAAAAAGILAGWGYALLAGATPATVRAAVLATALLGALVVRRRPDLWSALALAAMVILAFDPAALAGASFQLTFAAVIAVVTLAPRMLEAIQRRLPDRMAARLSAGPWRRLVQVPLVTLAAMIGTGPLVAMHFGQVSPAGLLTNLAGVPLAALVVVPLSLLTGLCALVWPAAAEAALHCSGPAAGLMADLARAGADLPGAGVDLARPGLAAVIAIYALVVGLARLRRRQGRWIAALAVLTLLAIAGGQTLGPRLSRELRVTFLDMGRGDAILVRFPGGGTALVDGGSAGRGYGRDERDSDVDAGESSLLPALQALGVRSLDRVYLTHGHEDHFGGLAAVLRRLPVGGLVHDTRAGQHPGVPELLQTAAEHSVPCRAARYGEVWRVNEAAVIVRHPAPTDGDLQGNDHSLVLELRYGGVGMLLTGDVESPAEARMLMRGERLRADVLKLAHHGSATSSGLDFLEAVSPRLAVATAGPRWGLPDPGVRDRLHALGIQLLTTGDCGAITVRTDGVGLEVDTWGRCRRPGEAERR